MKNSTLLEVEISSNLDLIFSDLEKFEEKLKIYREAFLYRLSIVKSKIEDLKSGRAKAKAQNLVTVAEAILDPCDEDLMVPERPLPCSRLIRLDIKE